ncbi:Coiled-coil domain-containing protein [Helicobacter pylori]|nr:Coiled-coil domain-containing protein [Helicobacter pylori]
MSIKEKEIELETLKREIAQAEASLEQDFIKHMVDKTNEKVEDLFFSNKPEFYRFVFTEQNNYLREKLTDKVGRAMDLSDEIQRDKEYEEIEKDKENLARVEADKKVKADESESGYEKETQSKRYADVNGWVRFRDSISLEKNLKGVKHGI